MYRYAIVCLCLAALAGCGGSGKPESPGAADKNKTAYKLAVIPKGTTHVFWKSVHAGALQAGVNDVAKLR